MVHCQKNQSSQLLCLRPLAVEEPANACRGSYASSYSTDEATYGCADTGADTRADGCSDPSSPSTANCTCSVAGCTLAELFAGDLAGSESDGVGDNTDHEGRCGGNGVGGCRTRKDVTGSCPCQSTFAYTFRGLLYYLAAHA